MTTEITCNNFFDGTILRGPTRLVIEAGIVRSIETLNSGGEFHLISPGFVDVQMNGFERWDVSVCDTHEMCELDERLAQLGTTSWLATIVTAPLERLSSSLTSLHQSWSSGLVAGLAGVHVEGPFLGDSPGAHNPRWIIPIDESWLKQLPPSVRMITLAPEQQRVVEAIRLLQEMNVCTSLGHSRPTTTQFDACVEAGARMVTHLFNGMSGVHHRDDGLALSALTTDAIATGLIADLVHCSSAAISLAYRAKPAGSVVLVSDSIAWQSQWAISRGVTVSDGAPRLPDGTLAGSSTPLAQCVANTVQKAGVSLEAALRSATSAPAQVVGLSDVGHITVGKGADVVALDASLSVTRTWRRLPSERA